MRISLFRLSKSRRGLTIWHVTALISFIVIALSLATTIIFSGFNSSEQTKDVLIDALDEIHHGLKIIGKISGNVDISTDKIIITTTPVSVAKGGSVDISKNNLKFNYKLIKGNSYQITYDDIYVGAIYDKEYNSIKDAIADAKKLNLIQVNPYIDRESPTTTSAFVYWVVNFNYNQRIEEGELAVLAIVYAAKDRPSSGEYILVEGISPEGNILKMERIIPSLSSNIVDIGGKIKNSES